VVFADNEDNGLKDVLTTHAGVDLFIGLHPLFIALKI